jgi:hypothetical protein
MQKVFEHKAVESVQQAPSLSAYSQSKLQRRTHATTLDYNSLCIYCSEGRCEKKACRKSLKGPLLTEVAQGTHDTCRHVGHLCVRVQLRKPKVRNLHRKINQAFYMLSECLSANPIDIRLKHAVRSSDQESTFFTVLNCSRLALNLSQTILSCNAAASAAPAFKWS